MSNEQEIIAKLQKENQELRRILLDNNELHLEIELNKSKKLLLNAQKIAKIGHWEWDVESGKTSWSDEVFRIFGFKEQSFTPTYKHFLDKVHPQDKKYLKESVDKAIQNKIHYNIQHRIVLADGDIKTVHQRGHTIYDADSNPIVVIGTLQDITFLKEIEHSLEEQREAFTNIFENASEGMLLLEDGKFINCNVAIVKMLRATSKEEIINTHPYDLSPKFQDDGQLSSIKAQKMIDFCLKYGSHQFDWLHRRFDGEVFWSDILLTRLMIKDKFVIHVSWRDISEKKYLEKELYKSNNRYRELAHDLDTRVKEQSLQLLNQSKMAQMGELISMIAHQWRQPLSTISATIIDLKMKLDLSTDDIEELKNYTNENLDTVSEIVHSLSATIDDFRKLYKAEESLVEESVVKPIEEAIELLASSLDDDSIEVETLYEYLGVIKIQNNEIVRVLVGILKNSQENFIKRDIPKRLILIKTLQVDKHVKIEVEDNGGGIESDSIEKIFNPYFSTKDQKNGTGLGLYTCKLIIEQHHGGKIYAQNTPIGCRFTIEFPKVVE